MTHQTDARLRGCLCCESGVRRWRRLAIWRVIKADAASVAVSIAMRRSPASRVLPPRLG